jgi:small subunit ribosomal protein S17
MKTTATKQKTLKGTVVSDKMKDTVVVVVERYEKHPRYQKYILSKKRFKAHNPGNTLKVGDTVVIASCRPISKDKHFMVVQ